MLDDDVFLFDVLILDKLFLIEEAGVIHDLVIGSYGVRNDLTRIEGMRRDTYHENQYNDTDKLHGKISIGGVFLNPPRCQKVPFG
jgi:hypothetical protein